MPLSSFRSASSLNGLWDFQFLGKIDLKAFDPGAVAPVAEHGTCFESAVSAFGSGAASAWEKMPVPSAFDAMPAHAGKRGAAVYRRTIQIPPGRAAKVEFGAVSMWCRIFIDGHLLCERACGYAPFEFSVPPSRQEKRELVVLVDNRFDFERVPMHEEYFDFYQYGGILRDVTLRVLPEGPCLDDVQVTPGAGYRDGEIEVRLALPGIGSETAAFALQFDGGERVTREATVENGLAHFSLRVPSPRLWSPDSPSLHRLRVGLLDAGGQETDAASVRFGLRRIEAREGSLWLNGKKLILKGYNRHEWHPNSGPCTPELQMVADLQILRDLGCNFVRGSHYPQDQRFLDLCDEFGFLVWEENLGWGQRENTFASGKFRRDHLDALRAMVRASFNHPCVVVWGFLNEAGSDADYVREVFEESVSTLRSLDPSRLVSYASMFGRTDKYFDLADIISLNIYPGWYGCEGVEDPIKLVGPELDSIFQSVDERGFANKPILISEIGAEGLYGWHDAHNDFFTEEYQAAYLREACACALAHPRCCGIALWHFSDVRTYGGGWSLKRPRTFNNKGTLDEYRRPKLAYRAVREAFSPAGKGA